MIVNDGLGGGYEEMRKTIKHVSWESLGTAVPVLSFNSLVGTWHNRLLDSFIIDAREVRPED
jgi:hypothetical protein